MCYYILLFTSRLHCVILYNAASAVRKAKQNSSSVQKQFATRMDPSRGIAIDLYILSMHGVANVENQN